MNPAYALALSTFQVPISGCKDPERVLNIYIL